MEESDDYKALEEEYNDLNTAYKRLSEEFNTAQETFARFLEELKSTKTHEAEGGISKSEECDAKLLKATARIEEITNMVRTKIQELQGTATPSAGGRRFESSTDDSSFVLGGIRVSRGYDSQSSGRSSRSSSASSRTSKSSGSSRSTASSGAWSYGGRGVDFS